MRSNKIVFIFLFVIFPAVLSAQNYDELKAGAYQLPALFKNGAEKCISGLSQWQHVRRPEILKLFEDNVYGQLPKDYDSIRFAILQQNNEAVNSLAVYKNVAITVFCKGGALTISLHQFNPKNNNKPVPVFLIINHRGKKADITKSDSIPFIPVKTIINAGYAVAAFDVADVAMDDKERYDEQLLKKLYPEQLNKANGMGALGAWAWAASRCIDWFQNDPHIDARSVAVTGHSRGGKAALWCGAQDERVAAVISNESGNSGAKLSRRNFGETVKVITENFPHWFAPAYHHFANREHELPVDQHMLLSLIAPRGLYIACASNDLWSDPKGQYLALLASRPAYQLYGFTPELPATMPLPGRQIITGPVGFHIRPGDHDMITQDWRLFICYMDQYILK